MARKVSQTDPALAIEFFLSGFYTHRSQLFAPFKGIGVNVVSFHDPVIDGANMEDTDLFEWSRRPGFSIFCPTPLADAEIVNDFYDMRNLNGVVISFFDSSVRLASFTNTGLTTIIPKTTTEQGFITAVQNMVYFSDGASVDMLKWDSVTPFSTINPSSWGIPAPTLTPTIFNRGCWLPFTNFIFHNAILDPNGNVEVVTMTFGGSGISGENQPIWPTTISSTINDGSIQWTNMGPLENWFPATFYPVPVVVLDTNGNLELATVTSPPVLAWNSGTAYTVGITVSFAGEYWTSLVANTNVPPNANYTTSTTTGPTTTTQPYWVQAQNPSQTGTYPTTPFTPAWNKTVGGTTVDGNYTWTNIGPGNLVESFGTSYVYAYRTIYGHLSTASPVSINTGSIFGPVVATITGFSIAANIVTFQGVNNFIPGNVFSVQGLFVGTYLNNQSFTIISTGTSPTQFSAVFDFPDVAATVDSGSTLNLIATVTGRGNNSPLCNAVVAITATQVTAGVVRVFAINNFVPGLQVTFSGLIVATFLNNLQFQIINVDPAGQWFEVFFTTAQGIVPPDQALTPDTGTATFNSIEIYRTSDGGGIYLFTGAVSNPTGTTILPFDSGINLAGTGTDDGVPGTFPWVNPNNVTSPTLYATVFVPTAGSGSGRFHALQSCQNIATGQGVTVIQKVLPLNVTAGNDILVFVTTYDLNTWTVSDTQGNVYSLLAQKTSPNVNGFIVNSVYRAHNVSAGATTIRLNVTFFSGTQHQDFFGFAAVECSGLNGTVGPNAGVYQASGTTFNTGTITTTVPNTVVFTFGNFDLQNAGVPNGGSAHPATPPATYTIFGNQIIFDDPDGDSYQQIAVAYQVQTSIVTVSPTWTTIANGQDLGVTIALDLSVFAGPSDGLLAQDFGFSVPPSIAVTGIEIDFESLFTGTPGFGILDVQLLKGGIPVGVVMAVSLTNANVNYMLGGMGNLWGTTWANNDFNSPAWGVRIIATQLAGGTDATFSVRNVRARITGSTSTTGWVFNDFTTDANLNALQVAPQNHLNDPPPGAVGSSVNQIVGTLTAYWNGRLWMCVGNFVYFDAGPDCVNGVPEESWPPGNRFQFVGPTLGLEPTADGVGLLVFLADRVNAILGGPETISFYPTDALSNFGISSPNAIFRDGSILGLFTTQKQYFELIGTQNGSNKQEIGEHVSNYLTENFLPADAWVTMHRDGPDVGVFISNGVDQVLRYGSNIGAWSVPAFPVGGAGALRSIETSVGIHSLMLASPVGGTSAVTGALDPQSGVTAGVGTPWLNPENITVGSPTSYATFQLPVAGPGQVLQASQYAANLPANAVVQGIQVQVTGFQSGSGFTSPVLVQSNIIANANYKVFGPPTVVQAVGLIYPDLVSNTPSSVLFTSNTGGNTILLGIECYGSINLTASVISDTAGNTYTFVGQAFNTSGLTGCAALFRADNIVNSPGINTITVTTPPGSGFGSMVAMECTPVGVLDQLGTASQPGSGTFGATVVTTKPNELCVVWCGDIGGFSFAAGTSVAWVIKGGIAFGGMMEIFNQTSPGSIFGDAHCGGGAESVMATFPPPAVAPFAFTSPVTAGNTLVVFLYNKPNVLSGPMTDTLGNTYMQVFESVDGIDGLGCWTTVSIASGVCAVILPLVGVTDNAVSVGLAEISNVSGTDAFSFNDATGVTNTGGTLVVPNANDLILAFSSIALTVGTAAYTGIPPYAILEQATDTTGPGTFASVNSAMVSAPAPTAASYVPTVTASSAASNYRMGSIALKGGGIAAATQSITPLNAGVGAELDTFTLTGVNSTFTFGGPTDLWGMPSWISPFTVNAASFGFGIKATNISPSTASISEVLVTIFYQAPGNYLRARDLTTWADNGTTESTNGTPYPECFITIGSITLSQPGAKMFPLQHIVGYFDAVGTLNFGASSRPDIWILPNEISDTKGVGFVYLPAEEIVQEPPEGQNHPSESLQALRWPINMMNSQLASQYVHHLQVKIQFEPENAPNTIKGIAFKEDQE